jgi:uncharacterized protein (DUF2062 family)|tara:strand:+ start:4622 stop:5248 length:627 start_codon:yes stop_codon:yes gene_type:complete
LGTNRNKAGQRSRRFTAGERFYRVMRLRLIIPMIRSRQPPENTARAVAVGLLWAFTPTFGVQMALTCVHWYIARTFFKRDFNLVVALAWTWVTNLFTVPICYYTFFLTGQIMLGRWNDLTGFSSFQKFWVTAMGETGGDPTSLQAWEIYFSIIVEGWGLALLVGSIPFAILGYICGYHWTLRMVRRWRAARLEERRQKAAARRLADTV